MTRFLIIVLILISAEPIDDSNKHGANRRSLIFVTLLFMEDFNYHWARAKNAKEKLDALEEFRSRLR